MYKMSSSTEPACSNAPASDAPASTQIEFTALGQQHHHHHQIDAAAVRGQINCSTSCGRLCIRLQARQPSGAGLLHHAVLRGNAVLAVEQDAQRLA